MVKRKLFIIGNGFDLAHSLPTKFDPHFKEVATEFDTSNFWELYQTREANIWSDFENLLAHPDLNSLETVLDSYSPDYYSDKESDRDMIITQVDFIGELYKALSEFAYRAEAKLNDVESIDCIVNMFDKDDLLLSFNYTHTLEKVYGIDPRKVLHIHGEVGCSNLILGYTEGSYAPEKYSYDVRLEGVGPYVIVDVYDHISNMDDYYYRTAVEKLMELTRSFSKEIRLEKAEAFMQSWDADVDSIIVYGHSCAIDIPYFSLMNRLYPSARWTFYVRKILDSQQVERIKQLIQDLSIKDVEIIQS